jgi:hypothetical protein
VNTENVQRQDVTGDAQGSASSRDSVMALTLWQRIGIAIVLMVVPLMLLALPLPPTKFKAAQAKQDRVFVAAIVLALLSAAAYVVPSPLFPRRRSVLPLIVLGTSLLLMANITWNKSFRDYVGETDYHREVFRRVMHKVYHWPMYGRYDNAIARWNETAQRYSFKTLPWVLVSSGIAAAWYLWARRRGDRRWDARSLAVLLSFQLALIFFFALCEPWPMRLSLKLSGYSEFKKDIPAFSGIADTLRNYVSRMPTLEWYGQHYPPGNLVLLEIEQALGVPGFAKTLVTLMTVLSAIPLYKLARELELSERAITATLLLFTANIGVLIYCTINTTSLLLLPGTMCLWMLVRSLKRNELGSAVALGLCFTFYLFFSFSGSILGVLMALTTALGWWRGVFPTRNVIRTGLVSLISVGVAIGAIYVSTRFNLVSCFIGAVRGHQAQQGNEGFDDARRYLLRSTGNIIAYLMSIVPLCIVGAWAMWGRRLTAANALYTALGLTVLVAGFSGLFYVETERIWIFLTPFFALAAGDEIARRSQFEGSRITYLVFLLVLIISCSQEFLFQHYR